MEITYPLSDEMLKRLIDDHWVAFKQNGTKVECVFPETEAEEKWSNRNNKPVAPLASLYHEVEPERSTPLTHRKVAHVIRSIVGPRFQRLTTFCHHISSHF